MAPYPDRSSSDGRVGPTHMLCCLWSFSPSTTHSQPASFCHSCSYFSSVKTQAQKSEMTFPDLSWLVMRGARPTLLSAKSMFTLQSMGKFQTMSPFPRVEREVPPVAGSA